MSFIWLAVWLIKQRPKVRMFKSWNDWGIALAIALALDLLSAVGRAPRARHRGVKLDRAATPPPVPQEIPASP